MATKVKHLRGLLIGFAAIIIFINTAVAASTSPQFCAVCHRSQAAALERSSHKRINCNTCHRRNDFFDVFAWRTKVVGMVFHQITFLYQRPVVANVSRDGCLQCHGYVLMEVTRRNALKVSHKEINDASYRCTECHNTVAHPAATTNPKFPTMDKCSICHDNKQVSASCEVCHMKDVSKRRRVETSWRITHGPQWKRLHGMGDLNTCITCHDSNDCRRCHNTTLPHPDYWLELHPRDAKADMNGCYQCHHKSYCLSCHGTSMPHGDDFLKRHSSVVKKNGKKTCEKCHLESGCTSCHARHIHPGLKRERLEELRRGAGLD